MGAWIAGLPAAPIVLVGEAGGALVLLGLLVPRRRQGWRRALRGHEFHLHSTGRNEDDVIAIEYNGFLVDRRFAGEAETEAVRWLLGRTLGRQRFDELGIKAITEERAARYAPAGAVVRALMPKPSWRVDLEAVRAAGGDYLATLSANTRQQIRRAMRLYGQRGALAARRAPDTPTALEWLAHMGRLHQAQWQARGEPGGWAFPFFASFQERLVAATVPRGMAEIVRVAAGAHVIGYVYNLISGDHVMAFVTGFETERDARLKPGLVSHALVIQRHAEEGRRIYDFLAGEYRYKANLGRPGPRFVHLHIRRDNAVTRLEDRLRAVRDRLRGLYAAR